MEEFRFVFEELPVKADSEFAVNFTDYYIKRNERVRDVSKSKKDPNTFYLITSEPGKIVKETKEISQEEALKYMEKANLVIDKKGVGEIEVNNIKGYAERIQVYKKDTLILDELQVEFETDEKNLSMLEKTLKPIKIIKQGLFDYVSSKF